MFDNDITPEIAKELERLHDYIFSESKFEEACKQLVEAFTSTTESLKQLGAAFRYCAPQKRPSNAVEVIEWRKRKRTPAFKCFFKAAVLKKSKKTKRPYKKKVRKV